MLNFWNRIYFGWDLSLNDEVKVLIIIHSLLLITERKKRGNVEKLLVQSTNVYVLCYTFYGIKLLWGNVYV